MIWRDPRLLLLLSRRSSRSIPFQHGIETATHPPTRWVSNQQLLFLSRGKSATAAAELARRNKKKQTDSPVPPLTHSLTQQFAGRATHLALCSVSREESVVDSSSHSPTVGQDIPQLWDPSRSRIGLFPSGNNYIGRPPPPPPPNSFLGAGGKKERKKEKTRHKTLIRPPLHG